MKLLVLVAALFAGLWLWRSGRSSGTKSVPRRKPSAPEAQQVEMVRCLHCSVHLPMAEAVQGRLGLYCNGEHRQLAEP